MEATASPTVATEPAWPVAEDASVAETARGERVLGPAGIRQLTLVALVALAALNVADVVTTRMMLGYHGVSEANPLAAVLLGNGTLLWAKLFCVLALALSVLRRSRPRVGVLLGAWVAVGLYSAAVLSNLLILRMLGA